MKPQAAEPLILAAKQRIGMAAEGAVHSRPLIVVENALSKRKNVTLLLADMSFEELGVGFGRRRELRFAGLRSSGRGERCGGSVQRVNQPVLVRVLSFEARDRLHPLGAPLERREEQALFLRMVVLARVIAQVLHDRRHEVDVWRLAALSLQRFRFEEASDRQ